MPAENRIVKGMIKVTNLGLDPELVYTRAKAHSYL